MKPLSTTKRRVYLGLSGLLFLVLIPILILYATGYRFTSMSLIKTGGIFISIPYSDTKVYINNSLIKQSGVFQKNAFVQNLKPGTYTIAVEKEGHGSWVKELKVFPQTVTEGYPFLFPQKPTIQEILAFHETATGAATNTKQSKVARKENPQYAVVTALFKPISVTATSTATSTGMMKTQRKLSVLNKKGILFITWNGNLDSIPHYFCENGVCKDTITIAANSPILSFDFFPGRDDLIVYSTKSGVFVSEIDDRSTQNVHTILIGNNLDVRVYEQETIYIKSNKQYFSVSW